MSKFHVNPETGQVGKCTADKKPCKYGGDKGTDNHYITEKEAQLQSELIMKEKYGNTATTRNKSKDNGTLKVDRDNNAVKSAEKRSDKQKDNLWSVENMETLKNNTEKKEQYSKNDKEIYKNFVSKVQHSDNPEKVVDVVMSECVRQHVGFERVETLINAYNNFNEHIKNNGIIDGDYVESLGGLAEPDNNGRFRVSPVTFASGGTAANHNDVKRLIHNLFEYGDELNSDEFTKEFLWIHPFNDGNGRTAWLIYNWKNNSLNNPEKMPEYF